MALAIASTAPDGACCAAPSSNFAGYVVVDAELATAPFFHTVGRLRLKDVERPKDDLPELLTAAQQRFRSQLPQLYFEEGQHRVEVWDAEDFDPWESLQLQTVRVLRYRQFKPSGEGIEAYWLTNFPPAG